MKESFATMSKREVPKKVFPVSEKRESTKTHESAFSKNREEANEKANEETIKLLKMINEAIEKSNKLMADFVKSGNKLGPKEEAIKEGVEVIQALEERSGYTTSFSDADIANHLKYIENANDELASKVTALNSLNGAVGTENIETGNVNNNEFFTTKETVEKPETTTSGKIETNNGEADEKIKDISENKSEKVETPEAKTVEAIEDTRDLETRIESGIGKVEALLERIEMVGSTTPEVDSLVRKSYADLNLIKTYHKESEPDIRTYEKNREKYLEMILKNHDDLLELLKSANLDGNFSEKELALEGKVKTAVSNFKQMKDRLENQKVNHPLLKENLTQGEGVVSLLENYSEDDPTRAYIDKEKYLKTLLRNNAFLNGIIGNQIDPTDAKFNKYHKSREEWHKIRRDYKEKESDYKQALEEYYRKQSWGSKAKEGIGKLFGIDPELPVGLQIMRDNFKDLKSRYARNLDEVMKERSKLKYGNEYVEKENNKYSLETNEAKMAFGRKFILKPNQELLEIKKNIALSPEKQGVLSRVVRLMSKYKWHTRGGVVLMAGLAGMFTGGVGAALFGAGAVATRMGIGLGVGTGTGHGVYSGLQGRVDRSVKTAETAQGDVTEKFSLETLNNLEKKLQETETDAERKRFQQKGWSVIAGGLAGGAAGLTAGHVISSANASEGFLGSRGGNKLSDMLPTKEVPTVFETDSSTSVPVLEKITVPNYSMNGSALDQIVVKDINLTGALDYKEVLNNLDQAGKIKEVEQYIALASNDILAPSPHTPPDVFEDLLFDKLQSKFGGQDWWQEAGISKVSTGGMEGVSKGDQVFSYGEVDLNDGHAYTEEHLRSIQDSFGKKPPEAGAYSEGDINNIQSKYGESGIESLKNYTYVVKEGDSLWKITENKFSSDLKGLSESQQDRVLASLFEKVNNDSALRNSIALDNGGKSIRYIYTGDEIKLDKLGEELRSLIEQEKSLPGSVVVETDAEIKEIKILDPNKPADASREVRLNPNITDFYDYKFNKPISEMTQSELQQASDIMGADRIAYFETLSADLAPIKQEIAGMEVVSNSRVDVNMSDKFLNQETVNVLNDYIKSTAANIVKENPNIPQSDLNRIVLERVNDRFSSVSEWQQAQKLAGGTLIDNLNVKVGNMTGGVEASRVGSDIGFHILADNVSPDVMTEMKQFSAETAEKLIADNPSLTSNKEALRIAVWSEFSKQYPGIPIKEFGLDSSTLSKFTVNSSAEVDRLNDVNQNTNTVYNNGPSMYPSINEAYDTARQHSNQVIGSRNAYLNQGNQMYPSPRMNNMGGYRGGIIDNTNRYGGRGAPLGLYHRGGLGGGGHFYDRNYPFRSSTHISGGDRLFGHRYGNYEYSRGSTRGPVDTMDRFNNRGGGIWSRIPNGYRIPVTETEMRMGAEQDARMANPAPAPEINYVSRPDNFEIPKENISIVDNEATSAVVEGAQEADYVDAVNKFKDLYGIENPAEAAKVLDTEIENFVKTIEKIDTGLFARLSGGERSPFDYFANASLAEFEPFMNQNSSQLKPFLDQHNMEYGTFLNLKNTVLEASNSVPHSEQTTIKDLFAKYLVHFAENNTNPSGFVEKIDTATDMSNIAEVSEPTRLPAIEFDGDTIKVGDFKMTYEGLDSKQTQMVHDFAKETVIKAVTENPDITKTQLGSVVQKGIDGYLRENNLMKHVSKLDFTYSSSN